MHPDWTDEEMARNLLSPELANDHCPLCRREARRLEILRENPWQWGKPHEHAQSVQAIIEADPEWVALNAECEAI